MRAWIVLPAYNEAENFSPVFDAFRTVVRETYNLDLRIVLVDDGSTDGTPEIARNLAGDLDLRVLRNERNTGLAATFMRGVTEAAAIAADDDMIVCMDADNSHLPGQVMCLLRSIQEGRDVVIVSRYRPGAIVRGVPLLRRFLSAGMSLLFRIVYPIKNVRDYSCGYRAYRAGFLKRALASQGARLFGASDGFACMVGILLRLHKQGAVFGEIPIVLRYDRRKGRSKMKIAGTIASTLGVLVRERFRRD